MKACDAARFWSNKPTDPYWCTSIVFTDADKKKGAACKLRNDTKVNGFNPDHCGNADPVYGNKTYFTTLDYNPTPAPTKKQIPNIKPKPYRPRPEQINYEVKTNKICDINNINIDNDKSFIDKINNVIDVKIDRVFGNDLCLVNGTKL